MLDDYSSSRNARVRSPTAAGVVLEELYVTLSLGVVVVLMYALRWIFNGRICIKKRWNVSPRLSHVIVLSRLHLPGSRGGRDRVGEIISSDADLTVPTQGEVPLRAKF